MLPLVRVPAVLLAVLLAAGGLAAPAAAHSHSVTASEPVFGGLVHERFSIRLGDGSTARGNIVRFREDDPHLRLRQVLAGDRLPGLETTTSMAARELGDDALAGTNGGYWLDRPTGVPNGFAVQDRLLVAGQGAARGGGARPRASVGVAPDGRLVMDQMNVRFELVRPDGTTARVTGVNRTPLVYLDPAASGELNAYDPIFGSAAPAPANSLVAVVEGLRLRPFGPATATVRSVTTTGGSNTSVPIPTGTNVLVAHGDARPGLAGLAPGTEVTVRTVPRPLNTAPDAWRNLSSAVAGGPLLVVDGRATTPTEWEAEAFSTAHLTGRHPRTAVGRTGGGEVLLVTVDGRRAGHSVGMTMSELQRFMRGLGSRDAVNLDGGGSTTMTVEGLLRNRLPVNARTGRTEPPRSVANGLFVYSSYPFEGTRRLQGPNRYATAAAVARRSHPDGAGHVVVATGESFPDALAGGPLAAERGAPLLLTARDALPSATVQALDALAPQQATILGGTAAVSGAVERALTDRDIEVERLRGPARADTAAAIGEALVGDEPALERVFLASQAGFADALSAAAPAGMLTAPILLTGRDELPGATRTFLQGRDVAEVVVVGGTSVVGERVAAEVRRLEPDAEVTRLAGANRYETARQVNLWAEEHVAAHRPAGLIVANGTNFPDALAGGPLAARWRHLLMIVPPGDVRADPAVAAYLDHAGEGDLTRITLLGGTAVLTRYQHWQLDQIAIR